MILTVAAALGLAACGTAPAVKEHSKDEVIAYQKGVIDTLRGSGVDDSSSRSGNGSAEPERVKVFKDHVPASSMTAKKDPSWCGRVHWADNPDGKRSKEPMPASFTTEARKELADFLVSENFSACSGTSAPDYWPEEKQVASVGEFDCITLKRFDNKQICYKVEAKQ